jgi:hypothetical protein
MASTLKDFQRAITDEFVGKHILKSLTQLMEAILGLDGTHDEDLAAQILNVDYDIPYKMRVTIDWEAQCLQLLEDADDEIVLGQFCENSDIPFDDILSVSDWEEDADGTLTVLRQESLPTIKKRLLDSIEENKVSWKIAFGDFELNEGDAFENEVLEYWEVSGTARRFLIDANEVVVKAGGMDVWCRTTSGQAIAMDACVQKAAIQAYHMGVLQPNFDRLNLFEVFDDHLSIALTNISRQPSEDVDDLLTSYKLL